ncbi:primosomal protein N' [Saccharibacter sp. 17.LH.SD]|uniref:primosomal protein N' n=1 Tax=Saccharibacter sp. 17.LH.SD TaxID=2689393 RepID=UPI00136E5844|nr:primosomal protein N' [Saccharibacter sp. 17.LH.SD]MXV45063.1 primosomal protein N' [Saccharibacter sp. 17.LH.SD]
MVKASDTVPQKEEKDQGLRVSVLVPRPFAGPLDYRSEIPLHPGTLVHVTLGKREIVGCVWGEVSPSLPSGLRIPQKRSGLPLHRLRYIDGIVPHIPPLPESLRHFVDWVAAYSLSAPGMVLAIALRVPASGGIKPIIGWVKHPDTVVPGTFRLTPSRQAVLESASTEVAYTTAELSERSGVSAGVVRGLVQAGLLEECSVAKSAFLQSPQPDYAPPLLSDIQANVAAALVHSVETKCFEVTLLEGVTGSGKTEVYFEAIAACLRQGQQVLVLLPEIVLTAQWTTRFAARFGAEPAVWHSDLGQKTRRETWCAVESGEARVVVGARSALFLPFTNLGLVVVDEEHESTYKQEEGVMYHGRDMAIVRARLVDAAVILVSATPSMETMANVEQGRYRHERLESRHGGAQLPATSLIDMRHNGPERGLFLSPLLCEAVDKTLAEGEQAMLFLNRRGYAPLTLCRACGHRVRCPNCSAWMVEHRKRHVFACHHCERVEPLKSACPECGAEHSLVPIGPGVERIEEEARARFPEARLLSMASDTLTSPIAMAEAVRQISQGDVNLIIGTQVVAKGWHFPQLTLVGVVDADLGLGGGDLRAAERTMQLLHQVAGRAGRGERPGRVMLQTYVSEHPVMQALLDNDFQTFMEQEAEQRRPGFWPPYGRLAAVIVSAQHESQAEQFARHIALKAPQQEGVQVLGPAPAPLALLRGRYRFRLLLRTRRGIAVQPLLRHWLAQAKPTNGIKVDVDIDPVSFM